MERAGDVESARRGLRDGELADSTPVEEPEDEEPEEHGVKTWFWLREGEEMIGNAAYLVL